jgi:hypothetical protein
LKRIGLFLLLLLAALVVQAPAWLADGALEAATDGAIRLAASEGSLWRGQGALVAVDRQSRRVMPWATLNWRLRPWRLGWAEAAWTLSVDQSPAGTIGIDPRGWRGEELRFTVPARYLLERIAHPFAHLGWHGDLRLAADQWGCDWDFRCEGRLDLRWTGVSVDVLRQRPFGDYQLIAQGEAGRLRFDLATLAGDVRLQGTGNLEAGGAWHLSGTIAGDPILMRNLPAVANQWLQPGGKPGAYRFALSGSR